VELNDSTELFKMQRQWSLLQVCEIQQKKLR